MAEGCPGADGLSCIDGWLYSGVGGMIFPANKKCPTCNLEEAMAQSDKLPEPVIMIQNQEWISVAAQIPEDGADIWIFRAHVPRGEPFVDRISCVKTNGNDGWFMHWGISHWQPCHMPDPPEQGEKNG